VTDVRAPIGKEEREARSVQSHGGVASAGTPETGNRHAVEPVIRGKVRHADGRPAPGLTVIAHRQGLGKHADVGCDTTHADGSYEISGPSTADGTPADGSAVLAMIAVDARGNEVARAGPVTSDDGSWSIDIVLPDKPRRGAEFNRLLADVTREAERSGVALDAVSDTTDRPDVLVLSRSLDVPGASVRALQAARSSARALVDSSAGPTPARIDGRRGRALSEDAAAAMLFALWKTSPNVALDDLLARPNSELEPQLRAAVDERIVPASAGRQIPAFLARLDRERSRRLAAAPPAALASVVHDASTRDAISDVAIAHGFGTDAFWDVLRNDESVPAATADQLETAVAFLDVSGGHVRLLDRLVDRDELNPSALAGMTKGDWKRLLRLKTVGTPSPVSGSAPDASSIDAYANSLYVAVGNRYPTERFVDRLDRDSRDGNPLVAARADIQMFVSNNPDFHLRETPIEALLSEEGTSRAKRIKDLSDPDGTISLLKGVQRITRLLLDSALVASRPTVDGAPQPAPAAIDPYQAVSRLIADGIDSAPAIVATPRAEFVEDYSDFLGGAEVAEILYRRASAVTDASLVKALEIHEIAYPSIESAQPTVTTWRDQFGSVDLCECEHCSSMTSPAAYLFDCLKLLQDAPRQNGKTPLDVLVQRRPDLVRLALNCDNTETRLPFIDLVNEILERRVARGWFQPFELEKVAAADFAAGFASDALRAAFANDSWELSQEAHVDIAVRNPSGSAQAWHVLDAGRLFEVHQAGSTFTVTSLTFQTVGTEEELRAAPAHVVPVAYRIVADQVFPWRLPFVLPYAEIQAYLGAIETSIGTVIEAFENGGQVDALRRDDVAASYLGLSPDELLVIAGVKRAGGGVMTLGAPPDRPADFWGGRAGLIETIATPPGISPIIGTWDSVLTYVPLFLERSELTYVDLLRLLDCYFVNPAPTDGSPRKITIVSLDPAEPATCELDKLSLKGLDLEALKRIHRFVRLRRALKWDYADLDRALGALGETDLGPDTVVLTLIDRLAKDTGWPVRELCALWGDLDHARYIDRSDERQAFAPTLYEALFRKNPQVASPDPAFVADPAALAGKLADHAAALMAGLTISQTDLDSLLGDTRVVPPDADLTLEHLSSVYRFAALASMAGITPAELLALLDLGATNPVVAAGGAQ
jgi:sarcosine oxidase gamma subunit